MPVPVVQELQALVQALALVPVDRRVQVLALVPEQVARHRPVRLRVRSVLLPEVVVGVRSIRRPKKVR